MVARVRADKAVLRVQTGRTDLWTRSAAVLTLLSLLLAGIANAASGLTSIDTGACTIAKVRTAVRGGTSFVVASSCEGTVLAIGYDGKAQWKNALSGFMNHDLWCEDITGDARCHHRPAVEGEDRGRREDRAVSCPLRPLPLYRYRNQGSAVAAHLT